MAVYSLTAGAAAASASNVAGPPAGTKRGFHFLTLETLLCFSRSHPCALAILLFRRALAALACVHEGLGTSDMEIDGQQGEVEVPPCSAHLESQPTPARNSNTC
jgi:hypothetical protein